MTKATIHYNGRIEWRPPAIYKSLCPINVEFFPFDEQMCTLKVGSWTYDGYSVDIQHKDLNDTSTPLKKIDVGIELSDYYKSTEWDLLAVPAQKYEKFYPCCSEPFPDIKFNITIRRKTMFYSVNLILPCVAICAVTLLVFYIPAHSGEKITMGITILNSLNIFLLLVAKINPPTSLATPLIGKYLLFTMVLVTCSIISTVFVLNIHFRTPATHVMSPWIRELFLIVLPRLLLMKRPKNRKFGCQPKVSVRTLDGTEIRESFDFMEEKRRLSHFVKEDGDNYISTSELYGIREEVASSSLPPSVFKAMIGVTFIADHMKAQDQLSHVSNNMYFVLFNCTQKIVYKKNVTERYK